MNVIEPFFVRVSTKAPDYKWFVSKVFAIDMKNCDFLVYNPGEKIEVADEFGAPAPEPLILEGGFEWVAIKDVTLVEKDGKYWREVDGGWPDRVSSSWW